MILGHIHYNYIIVEKAVFESNSTDIGRRKSINYWGITTDPYHRWVQHKSSNGFTDEKHAMIVLKKWTFDNLTPGIATPHSASLVYEHIIGRFKSQFSPISNAKSGNGPLEDPNNKILAKDPTRIQEANQLLSLTMIFGEYAVFGVKFNLNTY